MINRIDAFFYVRSILNAQLSVSSRRAVTLLLLPSFSLVSYVLESCRFDCYFLLGGFVAASQKTQRSYGVMQCWGEEGKGDGVKNDATVLFSCPNEVCVRTY